MSKRPATSDEPAAKKKAKLAIREDVTKLMEPHPNYNADITKLLMQFEKSLGDKNRFKAYETAAAAIAAYPKRLSSGEEARKKKIAKKVDEILKTGTLKKVAKYQADPKISAIHLLCSVSGVGPAAAKKWVESGITTLEQLKKEKLNNHQKMCLDHYDDLKKRIPRKEIDQIFSEVKKVMHEIDPKIVPTCCGSYRRLLPNSGDIDILIMYPPFQTDKEKQKYSNIIPKAVKKLTEIGILIGNLSMGGHQYMGLCRLNDESTVHRIDFKLFPMECYFCALLHFTGSAEHNRQLSMIAQNKGFKLSEFYLVPIGSTGEEGVPLEISSEEDIYEILGIPYRKPEERCL